MKRNVILLLVICCVLIFCNGCAGNTSTEHLCAKCGKTATTTISGPADIMQKNGISISDCTKITSNVYTAYICDSCAGPVAEIKPDPGYSGETPFYSGD